MNAAQKAAIFHLAINHYLNNEDFHLDQGDVEAAIDTDSVEDVHQAYILVDQENFQNKVKGSVEQIGEFMLDAAVYFGKGEGEGEQEDPHEGFPYNGNGHGKWPEDETFSHNGSGNGYGSFE